MNKHEEMPTKEKEVVRLLADNPTWSNEQIATALGKSERTIENQLRRAYKRFKIVGNDCAKRIQIILLMQEKED